MNADINSNNFPTKWGTFASVSQLMLSLPAGAKAAMFDISAAYHLISIFPDQQNYLCVFWHDKVYIDHAACFGLHSSCELFGWFADLLVLIYTTLRFHPLQKWVDNFFAIRLPESLWTKEEFIALTASFGMPWGLNKTRWFVVRQQFTGFIWDLSRLLVALSKGKLDQMCKLVDP